MRTAPGAYRRAGLLVLIGAAAGVVYPPAAAVGVLLGLAVLAFYRDPDRVPPPAGIVAPADGRVSVVRGEGDRLRVGVFMRPWDVHVARAPIGGAVEAIDHDPGGHWPAFSKAAERNERLRLAFEDHEVVLIAGALARRITPYVAAGDDLARGERVGHVAFGSRADVLLPPGIDREDLRIAEGDRVRAGETVLARDR